ncbi:hypothetical protein CFAEC_09595 [Corynebacterium faecale]|nr:hypothetical protein CFAEC_09595 [Corynebacterium faecale]
MARGGAAVVARLPTVNKIAQLGVFVVTLQEMAGALGVVCGVARGLKTATCPTPALWEGRVIGEGHARREAGCLAVEIHLEFLRGRAQADRGDLVVILVLDVGLDEVLGEHIGLGEEVGILLKGLQ